jgi:hypothetical protein
LQELRERLCCLFRPGEEGVCDCVTAKTTTLIDGLPRARHPYPARSRAKNIPESGTPP